MESAGTRFRIAHSKFQIENLRSAICNSERSEDEGGRQGRDLLTALGRARPLVFEECELSRYL
jgi:hypothetical protein